MNENLLQPAATLTVEILRRVKTSDGQLTNDVIASAFEQAVTALNMGIAKIDAKPEVASPANANHIGR